MKYTYIICMTLSSFFTHSLSYADTNTYLNTFFIPSNAFQQNTQTVNIEQMKPRHKEVEPSIKQPDSTGLSQQSTSAPTTETLQSAQQISATTKKSAKKTDKKLKTKQLSKQRLPSSTKQKKQIPSKYKIQDDSTTLSASTVKEEKTMPPQKRDVREKSVREMLDSLPSPNFKLPKYQQIYALYGLELRSAYRRGTLPSNYEQETTLSKANSIRRFEVK